MRRVFASAALSLTLVLIAAEMPVARFAWDGIVEQPTVKTAAAAGRRSA